MTFDEWQSFFYPFGYLSGLAFGARFLWQWILSERQGQSIVPKLFWQLSLLGNILLAIQSLIQTQFPLLLFQTLNGAIAWRNLEFYTSSKPKSLKAFLIQFAFILILTIFTYITYSQIFLNETVWVAIPSTFFNHYQTISISPLWHVMGYSGIALFNSRFWIQWWWMEHFQTSSLPPIFWWLSLIGGFFSLIYFSYIGDGVNGLGPAFGLIPYIRNLMFLYKNKISMKEAP